MTGAFEFPSFPRSKKRPGRIGLCVQPAWLSFFALMVVLLTASYAMAQQAQDQMIDPATVELLPLADTNDKTLHILRPIIHAEQDDAELCLEFDHNIGGGSYSRIASNIRLEVDGKSRPVTAKNISVTNNLLCLAPLEHRRNYHVVLSTLKTVKGEKLPEAYSLSFAIPDRGSSLAFIANRKDSDMTRWQDGDPVLRVINVPKVRLELYRITDPAQMVEAWRQRLQPTLAPTESAYFARHHGQLVWQGETILPDKPNKVVQQPIGLRADAGDQPTGLYLVIASVPESEPVVKPIDKADKTKAKDSLTPMAAEWLLHSDLHINAYASSDAVYGVTDNVASSAIEEGAKLSLYDAGQKIIGESVSDGQGIARIAVTNNRNPRDLVMFAQGKNGDIAFTDASVGGPGFVAPAPAATITLDKSFYVPDENVMARISAVDSQGKTLGLSGTALKLLRPDHSFYANIDFMTGTSEAVFRAPAQNGIWSLVWQKSDGTMLAQSSLRVTSNAVAPYFTIAADRAALDDKGDVALTIKSLSFSGAPQPYLTGHLSGQWVLPEHPFANYADYHFGGIADDHADNNSFRDQALSAMFMTDDEGVAILHENITPPADAALLQALSLSIEGGVASGAAGSPPFALLVRSKNPVIGIKPLRQDARFAENSVARFSIVALDGDGKRREAHDLSYQIFEEGRSFDWYQSDGRWAYKPQQQQRLLGGGQLNIGPDHDATIEWPVTAGTYHIDIVNDDGHVIARTGFSAGWSASENTAVDVKKLAVTAEPSQLDPGKPTNLAINLDKPSVVTVVIADSPIRQILHRALPAGNAILTFTPQADWGHNLGIWVDAPAVNGRATLTLSMSAKDLKEDVAPPAIHAKMVNQPVVITGEIPEDIRTGDKVTLTVTLKNNLLAVVHYAFSTSAGSMLIDPNKAVGSLAPQQTRDVTLTLEASREGAAELKLDITGAHNLHMTRLWSMTNLSRDVILQSGDSQTIAPQQTWIVPPADKSGAGIKTIFTASQPLYNVPEILTSFLDANPFATHEIARSLTLLGQWHTVIIDAGILPEKTWQERRHDLLLRLLQRQKNDGSFADFPYHDGDIASTAAAVTALALLDEPIAKASLTASADWLTKILGNSWFDEKERPLRASAYAAMAAADRLDIASLYYFADTSLDKPMPALAAAQLAMAFAKVKDRPKVMVWTQKAQAELDKPDFDPAVLAVLAANPMLDPLDKQPALQRLLDRRANTALPVFKDDAVILSTIYRIVSRATAWHIAVDGDTRSGQGIGVMRSVRTSIHNLGDHPVFLVSAKETSTHPAASATISRHVYRMNGSLLSDRQAFDRDATYVIVIEGEGSKGRASPVFIHDDVNPLIAPITCALEPDLMTSDALDWLRRMPPTAPEACEISPRAIDVALVPATIDAPNWRVVYLATAKASGFFRFSPPLMR